MPNELSKTENSNDTALTKEILATNACLPILKASVEELNKLDDKKQRHDVLYSLIFRMLELTESALLLAKVKHFKSIEILARSIFESYVHALILIENPAGCLHYVLFELINEKKIFENEKARAIKEGLNNPGSQNNLNHSNSGIANMDSGIAMMNAWGIKQESFKTESGKSKKFKSWYENLFKSEITLKTLSSKAGAENFYGICYKLWSQGIHGTAVSKGSKLISSPQGHKFTHLSQELQGENAKETISLIRGFIITTVLKANQKFYCQNFDPLGEQLLGILNKLGINGYNMPIK